MSARLRCWIHEDCVANPELGAACGPNVPDMPAHHEQWSTDVEDLRDGEGDGWSGDEGDGNSGGGLVYGDGYGGDDDMTPNRLEASGGYRDGFGGGQALGGIQVT